MSIQHKINKCDYYLKYDCKTKLNRNYCCYFFLEKLCLLSLILKIFFASAYGRNKVVINCFFVHFVLGITNGKKAVKSLKG